MMFPSPKPGISRSVRGKPTLSRPMMSPRFWPRYSSLTSAGRGSSSLQREKSAVDTDCSHSGGMRGGSGSTVSGSGATSSTTPAASSSSGISCAEQPPITRVLTRPTTTAPRRLIFSANQRGWALTSTCPEGCPMRPHRLGARTRRDPVLDEFNGPSAMPRREEPHSHTPSRSAGPLARWRCSRDSSLPRVQSLGTSVCWPQATPRREIWIEQSVNC